MKHLLLAAILLTGTSSQSPDDEVAIYSLALKAVVHTSGREPIALADTTMEMSGAWAYDDLARAASQTPAEHLSGLIPFTQTETAAGFLQVRAEARRLPGARFEGFKIVSASRLRQASETMKWREFARLNKVAPLVSVRVSAIGFNMARTQALLYVSFDCVGLCGESHFVTLDRGASGWRVTQTRVMQES